VIASVLGSLIGSVRRRAMMTAVAAAVFTAVVTTAVAVLGPAPAWSHSRLLRTDPADGSVVDTPVPAVTLTFNEPVKQRFTTIVVAGPGGVSFSDGAVRVVDTTVTQRVHPLRSGQYTVAWRAVSADTHPVQGEFRFSVALPPGLEPTVAPPTRSAGAPRPVAGHVNAGSGSVWLAGAVGVAVVVVLAITLRRRRRPPAEPPGRG
jgi:methionine-rich copper-binding protein CopC